MTKHIFRVPVDTEHFEKTITNKGDVHYWGSLPGKSNTKTFEQMEVGDEVLFYRAGKYVAVATIARIERGPELARRSWGETKDGATWELIYFLTDVKLFSVDTDVLHKQWGVNIRRVLGFSKLSDERAQPFLHEHGSVAQFL